MRFKTFVFGLSFLFLLPNIPRAQSPEEVIIRITEEKVHTMKGGFGASVHAMQDSILVTPERSFGGSAWGANPEPEDTVHWNQLTKHLDWLGMDWFRVEVEHRMFQPQKGKFSFENREMKILYRYLDYCEKHGTEVFLQEMYPNVDWLTPKPWRGRPDLKVRSAPTDPEAWSDGIVRLLEFLKRDKKYSCIKWFCIANEPMHDWSWWKKYPDTSSVAIKPALELLQKKLNKSKLDVQLSGPDWSMDKSCIPERVDFSESVGAYDLHSYMARPDWYSEPFKWGTYFQSEQEQLLKNWTSFAHRQNKPFFLSEFGTFVFGFDQFTEKVSSFDAVLNDLQTVVRGINAGVDGFNKWSLLNRGDLDGNWQIIDTWDRKNHRLRKDFVPYRNQYFMYGLLTRLTAPRSSVLKTSIEGGQENKTQRVFAACLKDPKSGHSSLLVLNDGDSNYSSRIFFPSGTSEIFRYALDKGSEDKTNLILQPELVPLTIGQSLISIPRKSFSVFSTKRLDPKSDGMQ
jgi:hypothetical protein